MAKMTPEREAAYALDLGVARSDLRPEARLEYDRLKPAWEERRAAAARARLDRYPLLTGGYIHGVEISSGRVTISNFLRTRTVSIDEICEITLRSKFVPTADLYTEFWVPWIELTSGDGIWIGRFVCGSASSAPMPERVAALDELRVRVGLRPPGPGDTRNSDYHLLIGTRRPAPPALPGAPSDLREAPPEISGAVLAEWAEWAGSRRFPVTRLRPGYNLEQVDAFRNAIRDTFLGIRAPALTSDEVRAKQFPTTRLRPGYNEFDVDAFLDEAERRLAALQRPAMDGLE
jgi:DivIVA domain-containing protein